MTGLAHPLLALAEIQDLKLFQDPIGRMGIIVLAILLGGLVTWFGLALIGILRQRRRENLPAVIGDSEVILDRVCSLTGFGISDRYLLKKVARRMNLPQPAGILLSPVLLRQAAEVWIKAHRFSPTQNWGAHRLDRMARMMFGKSLKELTTSGEPGQA